MNKKSKNKFIFFVLLIMLSFTLLLVFNIVKMNKVSDTLDTYEKPKIKSETEEIEEIAEDEIEICNEQIYSQIEDINKQNSINKNNKINKPIQKFEDEQSEVSKKEVTITKTIIQVDKEINFNKEVDIIIKTNEIEELT